MLTLKAVVFSSAEQQWTESSLAISYKMIQHVRAACQLMMSVMLTRLNPKYTPYFDVVSNGKSKSEEISFGNDDLYGGDQEPKGLDEIWKDIKEALKNEENLFAPDYPSFHPESVEELFRCSFQGLEKQHETCCLSALRGFLVFACHSDCDGFHSIGDCVDITFMFDFIKPLKEELTGELRGELDSLETFYRVAAASSSMVRFV